MPLNNCCFVIPLIFMRLFSMNHFLRSFTEIVDSEHTFFGIPPALLFIKMFFDLKVNCWRQSITKLTCIKSFKNIITVLKFFFIVLCTHIFHFYIQHPLLELFCCRICVVFFIKHPEQGNSIYKNVLAETKNIRELSSTFLQKPIIWKFAK